MRPEISLQIQAMLIERADFADLAGPCGASPAPMGKPARIRGFTLAAAPARLGQEDAAGAARGSRGTASDRQGDAAPEPEGAPALWRLPRGGGQRDRPRAPHLWHHRHGDESRFIRRDAEETALIGARAQSASGLGPGHSGRPLPELPPVDGRLHGSFHPRGDGASVVPFGVGDTELLDPHRKELGITAISCTPSYPAVLERVIAEHFPELKPRDLGLKLGLFGGEAGLDDPEFAAGSKRPGALRPAIPTMASRTCSALSPARARPTMIYISWRSTFSIPNSLIQRPVRRSPGKRAPRANSCSLTLRASASPWCAFAPATSS